MKTVIYKILDNLSNEVMTLVSENSNWSQWREKMESCAEYIFNLDRTDKNE